MLKYFLAFFIVVGLTTEIFPQNNICDCYKLYYKAEKAYYSGSPDSVTYYFNKAFVNPDFGNVSTHFNAADKLIRIGNNELAKKLLLSSASKGVSLSGIYNFLNRYPQFNLSIDSTDIRNYIQDTLRLDKFLLNDLKFIHDRDQSIRTKYEHIYTEKYKKLVDYGNFLILKNILDRYQGKFPDLRVIGYKGEEYLKTILLHLDIDWLAEIFPALVDAINKGYSINQDIIYQIDRNTVSSGQVYIYDSNTERIVPWDMTPSIANSVHYHQYYGGYELFIPKINSMIWWPIYNLKESENRNLLRSKLCLDSLDDYFLRRPYIQHVSDSAFLNLIKY